MMECLDWTCWQFGKPIFDKSNVNFVIAKSGGRRVPNMELLRKHLLREGHINKPELIELIAAAVGVMSKWQTDICGGSME